MRLGGMLPPRGFCPTLKTSRLVKYWNRSGRVPVKWLVDTSNSFRRGKLPPANDPESLLLFSWKYVSCMRLENVVGINPVREFWPKFSVVSVETCPRLEGIVPASLFPLKSIFVAYVS